MLPSFFLLVLLSWVYIAYGHLTWIAGLFYGIKPAVVAIVAQAAWRIGTRTLKRPWLWGVTLASLCAIAWWQTPFPLIVLAAALIGALAGRLRPHWFQAGGHGGADAHYGPALIDDHTSPPAHARFSWLRLCRAALAGLLLWSLPMALLAAVYGWHGGFTQMGWFFTKAALLTFGGAYAVLPLCLPGRGGALRLAKRRPDAGRPGAGRNHAGAADHGGRLRRFLSAATPRRCWVRAPVPGRAGRGAGDLVHLPALLRLHPGRRPTDRTQPWTDPADRAADRRHRRRGRGDRQPRPILRLACAVAARPRGGVDWAAAAIAALAAWALLKRQVKAMPVIAGAALAGLLLSLWRLP